MTPQALQNLAKTCQLKPEPPDQTEFDNLLTAARQHFQDACVEGLFEQGRFSMAYNAAHAMALAVA